jgi:hypothetical protein
VKKPLGEARLYDLGPNDRIKVQCGLCKRGNSLPADFVIRLGIASSMKVLDLVRFFRCHGCKWRGRAMISVEWASENR